MKYSINKRIYSRPQTHYIAQSSSLVSKEKRPDVLYFEQMSKIMIGDSMVLVSKCLLGVPCRMDGKSKLVPEILRLYEEGKAVAVCPEVLGGLPTPREPAERQARRASHQPSRGGRDRTISERRGGSSPHLPRNGLYLHHIEIQKPFLWSGHHP